MMKIFTKLCQLLFISTFMFSSMYSNANESKLSLEVFISEPSEINVTSALIKGSSEMMVVSAQGTKSAANRLADQIEKTGLTLKYIFLTHPHLDHSQGASVLTKRFPEAQFIATPEVAALQRHRIELDDDLASSRHGDNAAIPSVPAIDYSETSLLIDGFEIEIWKDIIGDAGIGNPYEPHVALYIPSLNALLPSDVVYFQGHVMMGGSTPESRHLWMAQLREWQRLNLDIVVPGHMPKDKKEEWSADGALTHTLEYIERYDAALSESNSPKEVINTMISYYPEMGHRSALYLSAYIDFGQMHMLTFNPTVERVANWIPENILQWVNQKIFEYKKNQYSLDN
ncbi:MBL fold metallo-hydrolase [Agarivorans sp. B2Z047]|uniref:MBL fold metallo-hydrolase n=1 Tax=Agarivorans sp. B2Z047 TaxID=2652721 RepID=UPI00128E2D85|nr:MBL fold metallo-hydrolase [Agarivorans sp. B2Z047]MPW28102.1 MBL fold metallo-hydrolase [Agarivorans sp. B2Z047]UQN44068.1 MBL fold metallo-hydrolase [Agarivorans sp. B2Z047]